MKNEAMTMEHHLTWAWFDFDQLSLQDLYDSLQLRAEVFVVEQDCPYLDPDGKDQESRHFLGKSEDKLLGYARAYEDEQGTWLGRIVTSSQLRGMGAGSELMKKAVQDLRPDRPILMHAQNHLTKFYSRFGFERSGDVFLEDGIPHILMIRQPKA
ncbi:MAG: ElaA protein [Planctomycetota bacterium]|jgi:ElaA protein